MAKMIDEFNSYRIRMNERIMDTAEMNEIFMIANLVGGSIVIPHYRRALEYWEELNNN